MTVEALPLDGKAQELSMAGQVPEGAVTAEIGIRINTEGAGPGLADLRIYDVGYFEGGESTNRVTDPSFQVLADFDLQGISVVPSDSGEGTMVQLTATSEEELNIGSPPFPVTPGAEYRFTTTAAVPEGSAESGYIGVIFLSEGEVDRHTVPLAPVWEAMGEATTDQTGGFGFTADDLLPGRYRLRISYAGDGTHWPSEIEQDVTVG
jgi:hypothetical protein